MASENDPDELRLRWAPPKNPPPPKVEKDVPDWVLTRQLTQSLKRLNTLHEGRPDRHREEREQKERRLQEGPETQVGLDEDSETRTVVDQKVAKILADDTLPSLEAKGKAALAAVGEAEESWKETSEIFYKLSLIAHGQ